MFQKNQQAVTAEWSKGGGGWKNNSFLVMEILAKAETQKCYCYYRKKLHWKERQRAG